VQGEIDRAPLILAWRSPTETLLLSKDSGEFARIQRHLASMTDGCMVAQTGGVSVLRVQGQGARELLLRLGATTAIPDLGQARVSRLAEVHVMAACVLAGEFLLLVERVYADHLKAWINATVADLRA